MSMKAVVIINIRIGSYNNICSVLINQKCMSLYLKLSKFGSYGKHVIRP